MWPSSSASGPRLRWRRWQNFEIWGKVSVVWKREKQIIVYKYGTFGGLCLKSILSRLFIMIPDRSLERQFPDGHFIMLYSNSHKCHKMINYGLY